MILCLKRKRKRERDGLINRRGCFKYYMKEGRLINIITKIIQKKGKLLDMEIEMSQSQIDLNTLDVCWANACRTRQYMLAYMTFKAQSKSWSINAKQQQNQCKQEQVDVKQEVKITHSLIEKFVGLFRKQRTHWSAIDFDGSVSTWRTKFWKSGWWDGDISKNGKSLMQMSFKIDRIRSQFLRHKLVRIAWPTF